MKSLYDKNWRYTKDGDSLDRVTNNVLAPIFREWVEQGYSPREISHLMQQIVTDIECETILSKPVTYTRQEVVKAREGGKDFWSWYTGGKQHIFESPTPSNIKDAVLVLPKEGVILNLPMIMRGF